MEISLRIDRDTTDHRGPVYAVRDADGTVIGSVVERRPVPGATRTREDWQVRDAGDGVTLPEHDPLIFDDGMVAAAAVVSLRDESPMLRTDHTGLTGLERAILDVAGRDYTIPGQLASAVRYELHLTETRYLQLLWLLIARPEAHAYAPEVVDAKRKRAGLGPIRTEAVA